MSFLKRPWVYRGLMILLLSWPFFAWIGARGLIVATPLEKTDAIAVLSGSATFHERTAYAAELYKQGIAPVILLTNDGGHSGWSRKERRNPLYVESATDNLELLGVPRDKIEILSPMVDSTYVEAGRLRDHAVQHNLHSITFVTSAYHTRRAMWTLENRFRGTGIKLAIQPVAPGQDTPPPATWWLSTIGWQLVGGEWVKLFYYHLVY